jgi:hypothetical protein
MRLQVSPWPPLPCHGLKEQAWAGVGDASRDRQIVRGGVIGTFSICPAAPIHLEHFP